MGARGGGHGREPGQAPPASSVSRQRRRPGPSPWKRAPPSGGPRGGDRDGAWGGQRQGETRGHTGIARDPGTRRPRPAPRVDGAPEADAGGEGGADPGPSPPLRGPDTPEAPEAPGRRRREPGAHSALAPGGSPATATRGAPDAPRQRAPAPRAARRPSRGLGPGGPPPLPALPFAVPLRPRGGRAALCARRAAAPARRGRRLRPPSARAPGEGTAGGGPGPHPFSGRRDPPSPRSRGPPP